MIQYLLHPLKCTMCQNDYYESGYWHDGYYCPACSVSMQKKSEEERLKKKEALIQRAKEIREEFGVNFDAYPDNLPDEVMAELNPKKSGRKTYKYEPEYCELLVEMANEGKTESEFAARINVTPRMVKQWADRYPKFSFARELADTYRQAWFEQHYRLGMFNKIDCNPYMFMRYGMARHGLSDRSDAAVNISGMMPIVKLVQHDSKFPTITQEPSDGFVDVTQAEAV